MVKCYCEIQDIREGKVMLFRIEDVNDSDAIRRIYNPNEFHCPYLKSSDVDTYIAEEIRKEVNGSADRNALSYSKSLAVCLLKYNPYADNELHILPLCWNARNIIQYISINHIRFICGQGDIFSAEYSILDRLNNPSPLIFPCDCVTLREFIVDVSDNELLNHYLRRYTLDQKGLSSRVSPEKDCEVIVMNPPIDLTIGEWNIEAIYILYALNMIFGFLRSPFVCKQLIDTIHQSNILCVDEINAFETIICYLSECWQYEFEISKNIYGYTKTTDKGTFSYSPINFFENILKITPHNITDFIDTWATDCDYQRSPISELCWQSCYDYLLHRR